MNTFEIILLVFIGFFVLVFISMYFYHSKKINPPTKKEKSENKSDIKEESIAKQPEQKPVPVGIIKKETETEEKEDEYDLAPLKESVEKEKKAVNNTQSVKDEIKGLSKEAKKLIISDILLPPKF